jgi:hypothetical protein
LPRRGSFSHTPCPSVTIKLVAKAASIATTALVGAPNHHAAPTTSVIAI